MTTPDYKALCAELLQPLAEYDSANPYHEHRALITRARAALAEPVGEGTPNLAGIRSLLKDAPVPNRVEGVGALVDELELMANRAADVCQFGDSHFLFRAVALLRKQYAQSILNKTPPLKTTGFNHDLSN